jgi:hypothetical protein
MGKFNFPERACGVRRNCQSGWIALVGLLACALQACPVDDRAVTAPEAALLPTDTIVVGSSGAGGALGVDDERDPSGGAAGTELIGPVAVAPLTPATRLDLLFMIDNSISMSDKQSILRLAVPDLMSRLVNPVCLDAEGSERPAPAQGADCPAGQRRQFAPMADVHVGIVSSSLGDAGANAACPIPGFPRYKPDGVDMAHLLGSLERSSAQSNAQGFLEWRAGTTNLTDFNDNVQRMVSDVGEEGCGWEASLESWYRFLVDPMPYKQLARVTCPGSASMAENCVQPATGTDGALLLDDELLAQRAAFLRDDSLVAVVMLSDENDCSAQVGNQTWVAFDIGTSRPMFKGSSACATDPNSKCCYSCPLAPPSGCAADPACTADATNVNRLAPALDGQNLRCYQQKRRFGVDFLYPTQRYVNALTQATLCSSATDLSTNGCDAADLHPNPLFRMGRSPLRVFLAGIIGVPWQAISTDKEPSGRLIGSPDILRFKTYAELTQTGVWDQILGRPGLAWRAATASAPEIPGSPGVPPALAQMVESPDFPRAGVEVGNPINGRDFDTMQGTATQTGAAPRADDLQYACTFPLPAPRDCAALDPNVDNCDCYSGVLDRPLCEQRPGVTPPGTTQYWAKAYPGSRQLQVLRELGIQTTNSIVASICARNTTDPDRPDFGYRPAMAAIIERLQAQLAKL